MDGLGTFLIWFYFCLPKALLVLLRKGIPNSECCSFSMEVRDEVLLSVRCNVLLETATGVTYEKQESQCASGLGASLRNGPLGETTFLEKENGKNFHLNSTEKNKFSQKIVVWSYLIFIEWESKLENKTNNHSRLILCLLASVFISIFFLQFFEEFPEVVVFKESCRRSRKGFTVYCSKKRR